MVMGAILDSLQPEFWIWASALAGTLCTAVALRCALIQARRNRALKRALANRIRKTRRRDHARNHFLAAVSHDLRQPLQAAGMFGEVLSMRLAGTPHAPVVDRLLQSIEATGTLLSTLIEISTLELGRVEATPIPMNIDTLMEQLFQQMEPRAQQKSLRFLFHSCGCTIMSDPLLLERLVRNLMVNALSYTETGGVLIGCRHRPGKIGIQVVDTGVGIPEDRLEEIFDDFTRFAPKSQESNLGLGLSVVRRTAQLLGHQIEVKSILGKGSSFTVWMDRV